MNVQLSPSDVALLVQLLETQLGELGPELRRTEKMEYHDALKSKKESLEKLLQQLRGTT